MAHDTLKMGSDLPSSSAGADRVLARGVTGVVLACMFTFLLIRAGLFTLPLPEPTVVAVTTVAFVVFSLAAPIACAFAVSAAPQHERRGWVLLAIGSGLMVTGDAVSLATGGQAALGAVPVSSFPALVWVSSYVVFFLAALTIFDPVASTGLARWRRAADIVLVMLLVAAFAFAIVLFPVYGTSTDHSVLTILPTYVSLVLSTSLVAVIVSSRPVFRVWHIPLLAAFVAIGLGSLTELLMPLSDSVASLRQALAPAVDMPWLVAYSMFTLAAVVRIRHRDVAPHLQEVEIKATRPWIVVALMVVAAIVMPAFVFLGISWQGEPIGFWVFSGVIAALAFVAMGRNVILTMENSSLKEHAIIDPLTELYNHRHFQERLDAELKRAHREATQLSLVVIDVDDFDQVNNIYGHSAGDRRLASISKAITLAARESDTLCRVGGDEFAIIMPGTTPVEAYKACLRLQDAVAGAEYECPLPVGLSMGVAGAPEHAESREDLVHTAEGALYWAKLHGRKQVIVYDADLVVTLDPEERIELVEEESYVRMVQLLASAVDARDPYTQQHSQRVASFAVQLGQACGLKKDRLEYLETAALLHDVGKIGVPDAVLRKDGRLSDEEFEQVKEHPALATRILSAIPRKEILPWISGHHEHWDGSGYPRGLAELDIPLEARILAICDAYDAMTSERPYRKAMDRDDAVQELLRCSGTQFDAQLTHAFVGVLRDEAANPGVLDLQYEPAARAN